MDISQSLADAKKEDGIKLNCAKFSVDYVEPRDDETDEERQRRRNSLQKSIDRQRRALQRAQLSPDDRNRIRSKQQERDAAKRNQLSPDEKESNRKANAASKKRQRAKQSEEERVSEREANTAARKRQRAKQSEEERAIEREANAASMRRQRAEQSEEERAIEREANAASMRRQRAEQSEEERAFEREANAASMRRQRAEQSEEERAIEREANAASRRRQRAEQTRQDEDVERNENNDNVGDDNCCLLKPLDENQKQELIKQAIKEATRTKRPDGKHKATVCVVCDRIIIGDEVVKRISKERIEENRHRISVESCEEFAGKRLPDLVVAQYEVEDLKGILLSPRAHRDENDFECCQSCFSSMLPSKAEKSDKPPKYAIANGFVIGHMPKVIQIPGESEPRRTDFDLSSSEYKDKCHDVFRASLSTQRAYGYVFAFSGGAQKSVMGNFTFFEMNQTQMGSAIHRYRSTGANNHLLCVLCGRFTPNQRTIARSKASLDTKLFVDLMTWFIRVSGHEAYANIPVPEECPEVTILQDEENTNNTDDPQNHDIQASS